MVQEPGIVVVRNTRTYADFGREVFNQVDQSVVPQSEGTYRTSTIPVRVYVLLS